MPDSSVLVGFVEVEECGDWIVLIRELLACLYVSDVTLPLREASHTYFHTFLEVLFQIGFWLSLVPAAM